MLETYRFHQVDVFTDRALAGNPLAVFVEPGELTAGQMQAIAREMNLSETTFVMPSERAGCAARVRIFTPKREIPFAGHPTIGTTYVLGIEKRLPPEGDPIFLEEGVGPVEVVVEGERAAPAFIWMRHPPARFGAEVMDRAAVAAALGLDVADLLPGAPIAPGSTGSSFVYVPLRDRAAVDRAVPDIARLARIPETAAAGVFVFAPDPDPAACRVYSRMFAPHTSGVPEDPATGSASGPLGAYVVRHGLVPPSGAPHILSEQGVAMGRPSAVHITGRVVGGELTDIRVGGQVVPVIEGVVRLPAEEHGNG